MANENQKQEQTFDCLAVTSVQVFPLQRRSESGSR